MAFIWLVSIIAAWAAFGLIGWGLYHVARWIFG